MNKSVIIHADDFGLSSAINQGILTLARFERISGTSVMCVFDGLSKDVQKLKTYEHLDIGLHITLTDQILCKPSSLTNEKGKAYDIQDLIKKDFLRRLNYNDIETEITHQFMRFYDLFGCWPDYIDGHQHVQLLKTVRQALLNVMKRHKINTNFIRSALIPLQFGFSRKALILNFLNMGMQQYLKQNHIGSNRFFSGLYDHRFASMIQKTLSTQKSDILIMCHPGFVDELLIQRDCLTNQREDELHYLISDDFFNDLKQYNYRLGYVRQARQHKES